MYEVPFEKQENNKVDDPDVPTIFHFQVVHSHCQFLRKRSSTKVDRQGDRIMLGVETNPIPTHYESLNVVISQWVAGAQAFIG